MQNNSNFTLANRKHLADMLDPGYHSLRERAKDHLKRKRSSLAQTIIREFAEKKGVLKVKVQIDATRERLNEQERELTQLGFDFDSDGDMSLVGSAGDPLRKILDARFDSLQVAMMTVPTLEDADKLLKSVSEV